MEIPEAVFVLAFNGISLRIHFDRVEFVDIEESSTCASLFESRKTFEGYVSKWWRKQDRLTIHAFTAVNEEQKG